MGHLKNIHRTETTNSSTNKEIRFATYLNSLFDFCKNSCCKVISKNVYICITGCILYSCNFRMNVTLASTFDHASCSL